MHLHGFLVLALIFFFLVISTFPLIHPYLFSKVFEQEHLIL